MIAVSFFLVAIVCAASGVWWPVPILLVCGCVWIHGDRIAATDRATRARETARLRLRQELARHPNAHDRGER